MKGTDGIYVTMGAEVLKAVGGYKTLVEMFEKCDGETIFWWRASSKPTHDFIDVYIVIGNKVRWRAKCAGMKPGGYQKFNDGRIIYAKHWMLLFDFERMRRPYEERRGFQGFRYK